ncbi:uncharacterized protein ACA1_064320 [Acanthamoeba castellanii str. Neff]|uniref:T4 RNA ligase 1-like N-terminal domain-containing protein n=1 Tax=Acanthamoeba castellanii (strain ATCC 30010 / Neff) TaxID=1257118 RepID=L8GXI9_ACACF|nr:uncharacterized protein ACA1_064320 [Acanthamoeba castellanii str. Neff]ELR17647.1 hypothetical protein ACA1_064320 [Acanthamoeba castellanii str. Neff]
MEAHEDAELQAEGASLFPAGLTLDEVREAVRGIKAYVEFDRQDHVVFSYVLVTTETFPDPALAPDPTTRRVWQVRRECRGLVFAKSGELLSRRYHKFFNINESREANVANIDFSRPHVILEKLDGSMVSPYVVAGRLLFATKKGPSPVGNDVAQFVERVKAAQDYAAFCHTWIQHGYTPLFEWCSRMTPIILDYPEDQLVLTALRHNHSGNYLSYPRMVEAGREHAIPVVREYNAGHTRSHSLAEFLETIKNDRGLEGCVLRFDDGAMFKIKTLWYHNLNRGLHMMTKTRTNNEKFMWRIILDHKYDDMKVYISVDERSRIDRFANDLLTNLEASASAIETEVAQFKATLPEEGNAAERQKAFAQFVSSRDKLVQPVFWKVWRGDDARESVLSHALKNLERSLAEVSVLFAGGVRFAQYAKDTENQVARRSFSDWH